MCFAIPKASKTHIRSTVAISVFLLFQYTALLMWAFGVQVVISTFFFIKKKEVWKDHLFILNLKKSRYLKLLRAMSLY